MRLKPMTVKKARDYVKKLHRHLPAVTGGLFAVGVEDDDGELVGVGIASHPPRVWLGQGKIVISRVATNGSANACSMILGALSRAAGSLGYTEVWTYTLENEPGTSLKAAGFTYQGKTKDETGRIQKRPGRKAVAGGAKNRWMRRC